MRVVREAVRAQQDDGETDDDERFALDD